ncbi:MAG: hypothetical protein ACREFQ_21930 [Stellaceae bacterium]
MRPQFLRRLPHAIAAASLVLALGGCFFAGTRETEAGAKAQAAYRRCDQLFRAGQVHSRLEAVNCAAPDVVAAYQESAYPYEDLVYTAIQARRIGAANVDAGNTTEAQYRHDVAEIDKRIAAEEARRRGQSVFSDREPTPGAKLVEGLPAFVPAPDAAALPKDTETKSSDCTPVPGIRTCNRP